MPDETPAPDPAELPEPPGLEDAEPKPPDPDDAASLDAAAAQPPIHGADRVPGWMLRVFTVVEGFMSSESRYMLGVVLVLVAIVGALVLASFHFFRGLFDAIGILSYAGLFLVNWIGNGGALVPIPGARFLGLLMIFQQAATLPSLQVFAVSGAAMALGLLSYYLAGVRAARSYQEGDTEAADQIATDAGMLDDPQEDEQAQGPSWFRRMQTRFSESLSKARKRAQPTIEKHGLGGMLALCFPPTPLGTAAAFVGGLMGFGFTRYLATSFAGKYLLAGIIVLAGLVLSETARSLQLPF